MKKIKFLNDYKKLDKLDIEIHDFALLMQCIKINYSGLSKSFIVYDTKRGSDVSDWYQLPKTDLILLIFKHFYTERIFTTLREWTKERWNYYKEHEGENFQMVIESHKK